MCVYKWTRKYILHSFFRVGGGWWRDKGKHLKQSLFFNKKAGKQVYHDIHFTFKYIYPEI